MSKQMKDRTVPEACPSSDDKAPFFTRLVKPVRVERRGGAEPMNEDARAFRVRSAVKAGAGFPSKYPRSL